MALLIGLGWALLTRRLTLGSETAYVEERRKEERAGRLEAEAELRKSTEATKTLADSLEGLTDTLLQAFEDGPRGTRR